MNRVRASLRSRTSSVLRSSIKISVLLVRLISLISGESFSFRDRLSQEYKEQAEGEI